MREGKSPEFEFIVQQLEGDRGVDYATVRAAAAAKGLTIYPVMYGRAKAKLGLVQVAPRGTKKAARAAKAAAPAGRRASASNGRGALESLESVLQALRAGDAARARYRKALERIAAIADEALEE